MAWTAIGVERFRSYQEYQEMLRNLTDVQELATEQYHRIVELKGQLAVKDAMLERLMAIALLTNPLEVERLKASQAPLALKEPVAPNSADPRRERATMRPPSLSGTIAKVDAVKVGT